MYPPEQSPAARPQSRKGKGTRLRQALRRLYSTWRTELFLALLLVAGVFLILERVHIRQLLSGWLRQGLERLRWIGGSSFQALARLVQNTTLSDLVGYTLVALAAIVIALRVRWRLLNTPGLTVLSCPRCNGAIKRVHRHALDRLLNLYLPVRRYRCAGRECGWHGLRVGGSKHS